MYMRKSTTYYTYTGQGPGCTSVPFLVLLCMGIINTTINALVITKFIYMRLFLHVMTYIKYVCMEYLSYKRLCNASKSKQKNRSVKYKVLYVPREVKHVIRRPSTHVHIMCSVCLVSCTYITSSKVHVNIMYVTAYDLR